MRPFKKKRTGKGKSPYRHFTAKNSSLVFTTLLVTAGLLTACGGGSSASAKSTSPTSTLTTATTSPATGSKTALSATFAAYRSCLAKHGITLPNFPSSSGPKPGSSGFRRFPIGSSGAFTGRGRALTSNPKYKAALTDCAKLRPKTGFGGFGGGAGSGFSGVAQNKAFTNCLAVNGLSLSDLHPTGGKRPALSAKQRSVLGQCLALLRPSVNSTTTTKAS